MATSSILDLVTSVVDRSPSVSAHLVRTDGVATRSNANAHLNELVIRLSSGERELLAQLLQYERNASLHDALIALQEKLSSAGWVVFAEGQALESEPNGYTLAEEFISRVTGL